MKKFIVLAVFVLLVILLIGLSKVNNSQDENSISMNKAYHIAMEAVAKENPQALLYSMGSTDSMNNPEDITAGKNGERRYWNFHFVIPDTEDHWIVLISNKKVKDFIKLSGPSVSKAELIGNMDSLISSKEALRIAKKNYKLKPGEGWAIGYHFTLDKVNGMTIIQVFGRDSSNNFTKLIINAETKEIIAAIHKVTNDGVHYQWEILNKQ